VHEAFAIEFEGIGLCGFIDIGQDIALLAEFKNTHPDKSDIASAAPIMHLTQTFGRWQSLRAWMPMQPSARRGRFSNAEPFRFPDDQRLQQQSAA
jgi:hypothetical protein